MNITSIQRVQGVKMETICKNCRYMGVIIGRDDLVCSQTKHFESVKLDDTCDRYTQDICESCGSDGSDYIDVHRFCPDDKPYIIRTEYSCKVCKNFWYIDIY